MQQLVLAVVALPFQPADILPVLTGNPEGVGLATFALGVLESEPGGRLVGLERAATPEPGAARPVLDLLAREVLTPLAAGSAPTAPSTGHP